MKKEYFVLSLFLFLYVSCEDSAETNNSETPPQPPQAAVGILPVDGEPCTDYELVPNNDMRVLVFFQWEVAEFAQNYELVVFEGQDIVAREVTAMLQTSIALDRGKTYSWNVISKNGDRETTGSTYSFTTPGIPNGNFAPYPAEISVNFGTNNEMIISWEANDEDGDALTFDVTVSNDGMLIFEGNDLTVESLEPIFYTLNALYQIEVITRDSEGNFSIANQEFSTSN